MSDLPRYEPLIPDHAKKTLAESDAAKRASQRRVSNSDQFRNSFISEYADQIEMIRRGAVVTETVADVKRRQGLLVCAGDETRPASLALPDGKPIPTLAQARRTIWWARLKRAVRNFLRKVWSWLTSIGSKRNR